MSATDIMRTWQWCRDNYSRHNIRLAFPSNTDPTKTYQWRYLVALQRKFHEWEFTESLCKQFIAVAIDYAKQHRLLKKGLAIFHQNNLMNICYNHLNQKLKSNEFTISGLKRTKLWLSCFGTNDLWKVLLRRGEIGGYTNIVKWYQANHLGDIYLALSKSCGVALAKLAESCPEERLLLPAASHLLALRIRLLHDIRFRYVIKEILEDDWRKMC